MKSFELGEQVFVEKYYRDKCHASWSKENCDRYDLLDLNKSGIYAGRRLINTKGYTYHIGYEEGNCFVTVEQEQVHLIAISHKQVIYVPDKYIKEATK